MKQAIIDIGSNSMRLVVYEIGDGDFKILFKEKIMAGLAGYVERGVLSKSGIAVACNGLLEFRDVLELLDIANVEVIATASLRNISNAQEALAKIDAVSGYNVDIVSGDEEARYSYAGAMYNVDISSGAFMDIGGASTEVVSFEGRKLTGSASIELGSLKLFKEYVKYIIPSLREIEKIRRAIKESINAGSGFTFKKNSTLVCVGGTARAVLSLAQNIFELDETGNSLSREQFDKFCSFFLSPSKEVADLILKLKPDRIHTMIPGALIMQNIVKLFDPDEIIVSSYGLREGYLCRKLLISDNSNTHTLKTGSSVG